ncbi:head GIN domain-containing protein [Longitalea luteola]|uniref:head GIN domain-containing protein n=1 Tax=Longitalea luteola TaxID=2812563 RepID=UPI001A95B334|nr:head GIN domain-containing protein [Longitalea luteola]
MKNFHLALCVVLLFIVSTSCEKVVGKGPVVVEDRRTATFDGLVVEVPADTYFTQDSVYKVELHAQENILDEIETTVINNDLRIRFRHSNTRIRSNEGIRIYVSSPHVRSLAIDGSGYLEATAPVTPANLGIQVEGSGSIRVNNVNTTEINAGIEGSGSISVNSGTANVAKARISGSGLMDLSGVMVKEADASISGSGNIKVFATETLKATISGSGSVFYKGTPAVTSKVSGSGTVTPM